MSAEVCLSLKPGVKRASRPKINGRAVVARLEHDLARAATAVKAASPPPADFLASNLAESLQEWGR